MRLARLGLLWLPPAGAGTRTVRPRGSGRRGAKPPPRSTQNNNPACHQPTRRTDVSCQSKGRSAGQLNPNSAPLPNHQQKMASAFQPQHLGFGQVQHYSSCPQEWNGSYSLRRQQAFIPPPVHGHPFSLPQGSPNPTGAHPHPALLPYPPSGPPILAPSCGSRPVLQPAFGLSHPGLLHQVSVGLAHRLLPSPTIPSQFKPLFPPHSYIASPAYASFSLSSTKPNQYAYI
ncbi:homeodomain-interacting protein kinase 3-like [Conger conger]|uniref:homeodomain-interacting protein kinase 3-like n=1 Tax=Conger conger TaxID=82655 RepID=UPI002A5A7F1A|nr:homeodomain-interacting protein kinase 3-like [Conger conger]